MVHPLLKSEFERVQEISVEMERFVPEAKRGTDAFRAELAGFLVVSMAACYENCIKSILVTYAAGKHPDFENFTSKNFERLSSRVRINDLKKYARLFDEEIEKNFKTRLKSRKARITNFTGHNIVNRYEQILDWRHSYAHSGEKNTTIVEALEFHRYASHVLCIFAEAFDGAT